MIIEKPKSDIEVYGMYKSNLKKIMNDRNITRTKLSRVTQIKYDIINKYYNDRCKQIDLGTMAKLCCVLKCNIQDIVVYKSGEEVSEVDE
ncbi:MAG: helix-turn-helix transcriptional regulator [Bacilli bacterium]